MGKKKSKTARCGSEAVRILTHLPVTLTGILRQMNHTCFSSNMPLSPKKFTSVSRNHPTNPSNHQNLSKKTQYSLKKTRKPTKKLGKIGNLSSIYLFCVRTCSLL